MGKIYSWKYEEIIVSLQNLHKKNIPINKKNINYYCKIKDEKSLTPEKMLMCHSTTINTYFGTIKNACNIAGVPCAAIYDLPSHMHKLNTKWGKENIKQSLRDLHKKIKEPIKGIDIPKYANRHLVPHSDTIRKHFTTIRQACEEADVPYRIYNNWTKNDIIKRLQWLDSQYGPIGKIDIKRRFVRQGLLCSAMFIRKKFGSLNIAAKEAGIRLLKQKDYRVPRQGKYETAILDYIEKIKNIKLVRQFFVDKYYIDGYDKQNNIVYEVDEMHHQQQKQYDQRREQYIKSVLGCEFIHIPIQA